MPSFKSLKDDEAWDVVSYLITFSDTKDMAARARTSISETAPSATAKQALATAWRRKPSAEAEEFCRYKMDGRAEGRCIVSEHDNGDSNIWHCMRCKAETRGKMECPIVYKGVYI